VPPNGLILVFDTTNAVLWAEEVAEAASIPVEVVPAPAESDAKCDLALACAGRELDRLEAALRAEGMAFRRWKPRP
jgi:hypothetical protein